MGQNKEQLQALLKFIDNLCAQPDNQWFADELKARFGEGGGVLDQRIDDIYEYCIEKVVRKQAKEFYQDLPIHEIIPTLENDYCRMEFFRRKDNFGDFCLAVYQQIECITNKLCERKDFNDIAQAMWPYSPYVVSKTKNETTGKYENVDQIQIDNRMTGQYNIAKLVLSRDYEKKSKSSLQGQYAMDKIRNVLYFVGYGAKMKSEDYEQFQQYIALLSDIYNCRNMNHRGNTQNEWEAAAQEKALSTKSLCYLKFMGALTQYVEYVKAGMPNLGELMNYAKSLPFKTIKPEGLKIVDKIDLSKIQNKRNKNKK